jgi:hypothetical protein
MSSFGDKNQDAAVMPDDLRVEMRVKELFRLGAIYTYLQELWSANDPSR